MAGKRPDQHNIEPSEAGATDMKNLPQTGRGHSDLDNTVELDRQKLSQKNAELNEAAAPFPQGKPAPSQDANRALREGDAEKALHPEPGAKDADSQKENPLV
jgi:hypothetical protein